jgi:hypothetical protein
VRKRGEAIEKTMQRAISTAKGKRRLKAEKPRLAAA